MNTRGGDDAATIDRIIEAAYQCFDQFGIRKTTIEDIATRCGCTRPTVYRYFRGKDDILRHLCGLEIRKVNDELRRRVSRADSFVDLLTECLLLTTRIAHENKYVRMLIEEPDITSRGADPNSADYDMIRAVWRGLLAQGYKSGDLATDVPEAEIESWLVLSATMLLLKVDAITYSDAQLRAFIRRFILGPILASPSPAPTRNSRRKTPA